MPSKKRIVIVEDNLIDQEVIERKLRTEYQIIGIYDRLGSLLEKMESDEFEQPDLILLDLGLPHSWGYSSFEQVKHLTEKCPIIVLSGTRNENIIDKVLENGAAAYINKNDYHSEIFLTTIQKTLN